MNALCHFLMLTFVTFAEHPLILFRCRTRLSATTAALCREFLLDNFTIPSIDGALLLFLVSSMGTRPHSRTNPESKSYHFICCVGTGLIPSVEIGYFYFCCSFLFFFAKLAAPKCEIAIQGVRIFGSGIIRTVGSTLIQDFFKNVISSKFPFFFFFFLDLSDIRRPIPSSVPVYASRSFLLRISGLFYVFSFCLIICPCHMCNTDRPPIVFCVCCAACRAFPHILIRTRVIVRPFRPSSLGGRGGGCRPMSFCRHLLPHSFVVHVIPFALL